MVGEGREDIWFGRVIGNFVQDLVMNPIAS